MLRGHIDEIESLTFALDGELLISGGRDHTIHVWDVQNGDILAVLRHQDWVRHIAISPNQTLLASAGKDGMICLWDVQAGTQSIRIDSQLQHDALLTFGSTYSPGAVKKLEHYRGERPIFDLYNIEEDIQRALARRVELKSGGYLIIDQTEALTTIDVNTGGFVGARNFDDTIFKTNLEAG